MLRAADQEINPESAIQHLLKKRLNSLPYDVIFNLQLPLIAFKKA